MWKSGSTKTGSGLTQASNAGRKNFLKDDTGAAAVELVFALPILLMLLFGIIQFGFIFFIWNDMSNAAREGARRLAVDDTLTEANAQTLVQNWLVDWPTTFTITACKTASKTLTPATCTGDDEVFVTVTAPMSEVALIGNLVDWIGASTLTAQVVMRKE